MTSKLLALTLAAVLLPPLHAQQPLSDPANLTGERSTPQPLADDLPINHGAPALQQLLQKLRTRASLMLIVAHPDDEDGGFLTFESRGAGARVAMLTLTRGEGGQNLMSADFNDALGLIRTQELLAADRYLGVDQFFGTEVDFGFSKTKEEAFQQWTHDRVLYDAVRAIRLYRPLVLASVFVGGVTDGHGHHQVAGEISQEAFLAAADPKIFPEMGLPPWAPLKVYARVPFARVTEAGMYDYATGKTSPPLFHDYVTNTDITTEPQPTVLIHEGDPATIHGAPALGMDGLTYVQFARKGLALQKTQIGPNVRLAPAGKSDTGYTLMASRVAPAPPSEPSIFESIDISLPAIAPASAPASIRAALSQIDNNLAEAQQLFTPDNLELTAPPLRDALRALDALILDAQSARMPENDRFNLLHDLRVKRVQLNQALALAHHLTLTAVLTYPTPEILSTVRSLSATLTLSSQSADSIRIADTRLTVNQALEGISGGPEKDDLQPRTTRDLTLRLPYLAGLFPTKPYFSRPGIQQPFYTVADPTLRNAPSTPDPIQAHAILDDQGVFIYLDTTLAGPSPSTPPQPAVVVPPVAVRVSPTLAILRPGQPTLPVEVSLSVRSHTPACAPAGAQVDGELGFHLPTTWAVTPESTSFDPHCPASTARFPFTLTTPPPGPTPAIPGAPGPASETGVADPPQTPPSSTPGTPTTPGASGPAFETGVPSPPQTPNPDPNPPAPQPAAPIPKATPTPLPTGQALAVARFNQRNYTESFRPVGYPGLTYTNLYTPATLQATAIDVVTAPNLRVACLPGTGDSVPDYLPNLGITPTLITPADLTPARLAQFDAVLLGVRAYAAHPELAGEGAHALNDFAAQGGVVIVQYNSGGTAGSTAPYPFELPGDPAHNVVEEAQPVTILNPRAPLLNWPNHITEADFNGWVEERGHGFPSTWDPRYEALLETHDPSQDPQRGGLLLAPVGQGAYLYLAYALYRQLPEGVPGAYRLLANLLSYPRNPQRLPTPNH